MIKVIPPSKPIHAEIAMPGSKSITNRVLLLAALAKGESTLTNVLESDDTFYMQEALRKLGVQIQSTSNKIMIQGTSGNFNDPKEDLFLGNAGTATRFLTAALTINAFQSTITGDKRMKERPIKDLTEALKQLGAKITFTDKTTCPPLTCQGPLKGGTCEVNGNISSQYLSALLIASPYAQEDTIIKVKGELVSKPYINITLECIRAFGVKIAHQDHQIFSIPSRQHYLSCDFEIEGDASAATYFLGIAALTQGKTTITNIGQNAIQGDVDFTDVLKKMGCNIQKNDNIISVEGPSQLNSLGKIDLTHIPDAAMTVAILCAFTKGSNHLTGLHNLRVKECDRINALATELQKMGVDAKETKNGLIINGNPEILHGADIETYDDHRMAMCFAVAGTKTPGIRIKNPECTSKTYPLFWEDLEKIGITIQKA